MHDNVSEEPTILLQRRLRKIDGKFLIFAYDCYYFVDFYFGLARVMTYWLTGNWQVKLFTNF